MKLAFVYKICPAIVIYTDRIPEGFAGMANAMIVRIRPKFKSDAGLLQHELTHVKQSYRLFFLFSSLLYLLDDDYRLYAEVEAYCKQLEYSQDKDADVDLFAWFISTKYDLNVSQEAAAVFLKDGGQ